MALINQGGKLLVRDGKLATGESCCCGDVCTPATCPNGNECEPPCVCVDGQCVPKACCQCDNWQIKVNGVPVAALSTNPCLKLGGNFSGEPSVSVGTVDADPPYDIYDDPSWGLPFVHTAFVTACVECVNNELIVVLGLSIVSKPENGSFVSNYSAYFKVGANGCSGQLATTLMDPPPDGAISLIGDGVYDGELFGNVVGRENSNAFPDENGNFPLPALFDASQLTVTLECNPAGACCYGEEGQPLSCADWAGRSFFADYFLDPPRYWTGTQSHCETVLGGTWEPTARCADDPCNPLP